MIRIDCYWIDEAVSLDVVNQFHHSACVLADSVLDDDFVDFHFFLFLEAYNAYGSWGTCGAASYHRFFVVACDRSGYFLVKKIKP